MSWPRPLVMQTAAASLSKGQTLLLLKESKDSAIVSIYKTVVGVQWNIVFVQNNLKSEQLPFYK